ncbi:AraC family transcriptional regulator [Saccharospirillum mangrovi]|uniref:AraC family transcriptional regulator n=1 Tax=Saccharospirillum mangrovi TaxID=2161747 RepID=UPI000D367C9D|nr:AraC family transcriptional regulator [Saccharospirillum mangrovi]
MHQKTVTQSFTQAILTNLPRLGLSLPQPLQTELSGYDPSARVPLSLQDRIWQSALELSGDPSIGLRLSQHFLPGNLDIVGFLLLSSETLEETLETLIAYYPLVGEGGEFTFTQADGRATLIYAPTYDAARAQRVEAALATLVHLGRWMTGDRFQPERIAFTHGPQAPAELYRQFLGTEVSFHQVADAVQFDAAQLQLPLNQSNAALYRRMKVLADHQLSELVQGSVSAEVSDWIRAQPRWGRDRIAEQLQISGRHLNRKLADEGTTFKLLSDRVKFDEAKRLLSGDHGSLAEIAGQLGFSDDSAFSKAFRRWAGCSPSQYAAEHH